MMCSPVFIICCTSCKHIFLAAKQAMNLSASFAGATCPSIWTQLATSQVQTIFFFKLPLHHLMLWAFVICRALELEYSWCSKCHFCNSYFMSDICKMMVLTRVMCILSLPMTLVIFVQLLTTCYNFCNIVGADSATLLCCSQIQKEEKLRRLKPQTRNSNASPLTSAPHL